ncbi:MAG: TetR/AcrR family transcriptional regulator [Polyangiales bacterium]
MGTRLDTDERRQQLLKLGLELFDRHSYESLSIEAIASEAGISKGLLYHYFPGKRAFYVAVVESAASMLLERAAAASEQAEQLPNATPLELLVAGIDAYLDFAETYAFSFRFVLRAKDEEVQPILQSVRRHFVDQLLQDGGNPLGAVGLIAFAEAVTLDWLDAPEAWKREDILALIVRVAVPALMP